MSEERDNGPSLSERLHEAQRLLAAGGVGKSQTNQHDRYNFRGIDDVYQVIGPVFAHVGITLIPGWKDVEITERPTAKGGIQYHAVVKGSISVVGGGENITGMLIGEACDRGDKAIGKAQSSGLKQWILHSLLPPMEGEPDADFESPNAPSADDFQANHDAAYERNKAAVEATKDALSREQYVTAYECWTEIPRDDAISIYSLAPSKGGCLTTKERKQMKSDEWSAARHEVSQKAQGA